MRAFRLSRGNQRAAQEKAEEEEQKGLHIVSHMVNKTGTPQKYHLMPASGNAAEEVFIKNMLYNNV